MTGGSERAGGFIRDLGEAARKNPVSAALIGMGAVWLFASRSEHGGALIRRSGIDRLPDVARDAWEGKSSNLLSGTRSIRETMRETTDAIRERGEGVVEGVSETGKRLARTAADYAEDLPEQAGNMLDDVSSRMTELFRAQPLAIGAVGLAIGAAIAASLPRTAAEEEYFGESSEFIKQKAAELAGEQAERAREVGQKVADAVADEVRRQGLTPDGLKSAASDLSGKAQRVAEAATASPSSSSRLIVKQEPSMHQLIYIVGLIVVILAILSFFGLR